MWQPALVVSTLPCKSQSLNRSQAWHHYNAHQMVLPLVFQMFSRVLVGVPACRNKEWLKTSVGYTQAVFELAGSLRGLNPLLRPLVYLLLPSRKKLHKQLEIAGEHLLPLMASMAVLPGDRQEMNLLQWMINSAQGADRNPEMILRKALFLVHGFHSHKLDNDCTRPVRRLLTSSRGRVLAR